MISNEKLELIKDYSKETINLFYKDLKKNKIQEFYILWNTAEIGYYNHYKTYIISFDIEPIKLVTLDCEFDHGKFNLSMPLETFTKYLWLHQHKKLKNLIIECNKSYIKFKAINRRFIKILEFNF